MGAFDTYEGWTRCPRCECIHELSGQTKVFDPDFGGQCNRHFKVGRPQPLDYPPANMTDPPVWDEWWRVHDEPRQQLAILVDFDELMSCSCGCPLVIIMHFEFDDQAPSATLRSIELLDALAEDTVDAIDLAPSESVVHWAGDYQNFSRALDALVRATPQQRAARLREAIAERFEGHERWIEGLSVSSPWTHAVGPMRCEACGQTRRRWAITMVSHPSFEQSLLGAGWSGGGLRPGVRIESAVPALSGDEDRGYYVRMHDRPLGDSVVVCGGRESWGCSCGAGRAHVILHFAVDGEAVVLESITLRALYGPEDLEDVDFVCAPHYSRAPRDQPFPRWQPENRAQALEALFRDWGIEPEE